MSETTQSSIISVTRKGLDLSLRDFSSVLGISHNAVALWENGKAQPELERIIAWLGSDTEWIRNMAVALLGCHFGNAIATVLETYKPIGA